MFKRKIKVGDKVSIQPNKNRTKTFDNGTVIGILTGNPYLPSCFNFLISPRYKVQNYDSNSFDFDFYQREELKLL